MTRSPLALTVSLLLAGTMLAGCAKKPASEEQAAAPAAPVATAPAPAPATAPRAPIGTAAPIRLACPAARASERSSFSVAPDESWLVDSQEDYRSRDIMLIPLIPRLP